MLNLSYSTTRKYLKALQDRGFITIKMGEHGALLDEHAVKLMTRLVELIRDGNTLQVALEKLARGMEKPSSEIIEYLQRLERRIEELEKENRALRQLIQVYLSRLDEPKGLPKPRRSLLELLKSIFRRGSHQ